MQKSHRLQLHFKQWSFANFSWHHGLQSAESAPEDASQALSGTYDMV